MRVKVCIDARGIYVVSPTAQWAYVEHTDGTVSLHVANSTPLLYAHSGHRRCTLRAGVHAEDITNALHQAQRAGAPDAVAYKALCDLGLLVATDWGAVVRNGCNALIVAWGIRILLVGCVRALAQ